MKKMVNKTKQNIKQQGHEIRRRVKNDKRERVGQREDIKQALLA